MGSVARGIVAYGIPFKEAAEGEAFEWAQQFEGDGGWERKEAFVEEHGVDVEYLGRDDYGLPFVHVVASLRDAAWAETVQISDLAVGADWDSRLRSYAQASGLDLDLTDGPGWYLSSSNG